MLRGTRWDRLSPTYCCTNQANESSDSMWRRSPSAPLFDLESALHREVARFGAGRNTEDTSRS